MKKSTRKVLISLLLTFIILSVGAIVYQRFVKQKRSTVSEEPVRRPLKNVTIAQFSPENIVNTISIDGRLTAFEKVDLYAEASGVLKPTSKVIKEGSYVEKGELLFDIDGEDAELSLLAQRSALMTSITQIMPDLKFDFPDAFEKWKLYLDQFDVTQSIREFPAITTDQEKYYVAGKNLYNQYYTIKSAERKLQDYKVYAPFSGVITQASIYPGQLVNMGVNLGSIMNTGRFEMKAPISLADLEYVKAGQPVTLHSREMKKNWKGTVSRISRVIDDVTQNLPVYITVYGIGLRDGMYLSGELSAGKMENVIPLSKNLIKDRNKVFIVKDSIINLKEIIVIKQTETKVFVKGIEPDDQIVSSSHDGIFSGLKVNTTR